MAKKGCVLRSDIERAIEEELASKGALKANANARSCISDYKKQVPNQSREILILNEGDRELEQYRCQELGEWLYRRQGSLKEFRTPVCPCCISFDLSITEGRSGNRTKESQTELVEKSLVLRCLVDIGNHVKLFYKELKPLGRPPAAYVRLDLEDPEQLVLAILKTLQKK